MRLCQVRGTQIGERPTPCHERAAWIVTVDEAGSLDACDAHAHFLAVRWAGARGHLVAMRPCPQKRTQCKLLSFLSKVLDKAP